MTAMAVMATIATVLCSSGIRDYSRQMTRRQDTFRTSTESSSAGVWVNFVSTPSEELGSNTLGRSLGQHGVRTLGGVRVTIRMSSSQYRFYTLGEATHCIFNDDNVLNNVSSVYKKRFGEQVNQCLSQPDRHTVWYMDSL